MSKKGMTPEVAEELRIKKDIGRGSKLRRLRVKKELSQSELADLSGVPLKTLQKYEQGTTPLDGAKLNTICNLCIALNCKIEDIIEDEELIEKYTEIK
jgi:transcriptional regulator with XRE-family HTH domain